MRKFLLSIAFLAMIIASYSQGDAYSLQNQADKRIKIDEHIAASGELEPFTDDSPISGLAISGDITLNSDSSLVRVILIDSKYNEYLVYESYILLADSRSFTINETGEETALLNNIIPVSVKVEIIDASIHLKEIITSKADIYGARAVGNLQQKQLNEKIIKINQSLEERNIPWVAGETSFSKLTYQEKKAHFDGELPNLSGFEYYTGGIFVLPGALEDAGEMDTDMEAGGIGDSPYVKEFDWRNRHGQNWVTPVKNQSACGSCWAFAAAGATEHMANIYFNQLLNLNLSEQQIVSCANAGSCNGGYVPLALNYIRNTGIVAEDCFPYKASNGTCSEMCQNPTERIRIGAYQNYLSRTEDNYKKVVLEGASTFGIIPWRHAITLVGYKTLNAGDRIYIRSSDANQWVTISNTSALIGKTAWLLKNSWGTYWGDGGYAYVVTNLSDISPYHTCKLTGTVSSPNYNSSDIACTDNDGDGYYFWGIGPKPSHCPPCPDGPDGDDSNPCFGPMDEYGNLQSFNSPKPEAVNVSVFQGQEVPNLMATGTDVRWYGEYELTTLLYSGSSYATGQTLPGIYTYYATQSVNGCESAPEAVLLTIHKAITPPEVDTGQVCQGKSTALHASGVNIKWYSDPQLNTLLAEGNEYTPSVVEPGSYKFYVTQTIEGIESTFTLAEYFIIQAPQPVYVDDKVFCSDTGLFMYAEGNNITWYSGNYSNELYDERDKRTYRTVNIGNQVWMAENLDIGTPIAGTEMQQNNVVIEKYNYNDDPVFGNSYGGLYQWDELMAYSTEVGAQGICPVGWHIPSHKEWQKMEISLGMSEEEAAKLGLRGIDEGAKLKQGGSSGFESLFGGKRNSEGYFESLGYYATYWTSDGYTRTMSDLFDQVYASKGDDIVDGYSVRCVLDDSAYVSYGSSLDVSDYTPGDYTFYVTNTYSGCVSQPDTATLSLRETPPPPMVSDIEVCQMEEAPILIASGENVKWYYDIPEESFVDERDGKEYNALKLGRQVWMAENLDYGVRIEGTKESTDNGIVEKYYYNDETAMGDIYGGLYQWDELMNYSTLENTQGICPAGWEVPSHKDWMELEMELGMNQAEATLFEWRGTDQGNQLKEGGSSGFNAKMGGKRDPEGQFKSINDWATFWNSTGYTRSLEASTLYRPKIWNSRFDEYSNGFYLRCIMNDSAYSSLGNEFVAPQNSPGIYSFEVTQTKDGCESRSASVTLTIKETPIPPEGTNLSICEGDPVPALEASGENISWYIDEGLNELVHTGNVFQTGQTLPGTYVYYATQNSGDCESIPDTIVLTIQPLPEPPSEIYVSVCEGMEIPDLDVEGTNISWYNDEALLNLAHTGPHFATGETEPGTYTYYTTRTLSGCMSSASSAILVIGEVPIPPLTENIEICEGDPLPALVATGENIRWYLDKLLTDLVHSGDSLKLETNAPGTRIFYATQTINNCESPASTASLTIKLRPGPPVSKGVSVCETEEVPVLEATGDSIRWYDKSTLDNIIQFGNTLETQLSDPGSYLFYITQTWEGCEGLAEEVELVIKKSPIISLGIDTLIRDDQYLILGPYPVEYTYLWSNTSKEPYLKFDGEETGPGIYEISVQVSNNTCVFRDTITITVESTIGINRLGIGNFLKVYPNPTKGFITVEVSEKVSENSFIEIIDAKGALVQKFRIKELQMGSDRSFRISLGTMGLYYLRIYHNDQIYSGKVIRY